jgi:hypothetical protein
MTRVNAIKGVVCPCRAFKTNNDPEARSNSKQKLFQYPKVTFSE